MGWCLHPIWGVLKKKNFRYANLSALPLSYTPHFPNPRNIPDDLATRWWKNFGDTFIRFGATHERDGQTDTGWQHIPRLCIASRGNKTRMIWLPRVVKKLWRNFKPFQCNIGKWQTDRRTDTQNSYINNCNYEEKRSRWRKTWIHNREDRSKLTSSREKRRKARDRQLTVEITGHSVARHDGCLRTRCVVIKQELRWRHSLRHAVMFRAHNVT